MNYMKKITFNLLVYIIITNMTLIIGNLNIQLNVTVMNGQNH